MGNAVVTPGRRKELMPGGYTEVSFQLGLSSSYASGGDTIVAGDIAILMPNRRNNALADLEILIPTPALFKTTAAANIANSGTVTVVSTASFPASGTFFLFGLPVTYTGKSGTTFTGCSAHALTVGGEVITGMKAYSLHIDRDNNKVRVFDAGTEITAATDLSNLVATCIAFYYDVHFTDSASHG